ncbi:MAG TPA: amidohydrolase family protein [Candidatus Angelobacter sp.]|nr:amidohydrolase family protein [Candidatus Angelobacter sp.]
MPKAAKKLITYANIVYANMTHSNLAHLTLAHSKMTHSKTLFFLPLLFCSLVYGSLAYGTTGEDLVLTGGKVYPSPKAKPIENAVVVIHEGKITAIGPREQLKSQIASNARTIDCTGKIIVAGFWNSHVHFTNEVWVGAAEAPAGKLESHLKEMLTRWGFTTVFDLGSNPQDTLALRRRIENGDIAGPRIYTTAGTIFPKDGIPFYLPPQLAQVLKSQEAESAEDAARLTRQALQLGGDGMKVFAGSMKGGNKVVPMPAPIIKGAVDVAHAAGKPVFAHPSNHVGTDNALAAGVDVLAHTIPMETAFTEQELQQMKKQHTALIPTLALFPDEVSKSGGSEEEKHQILDRAEHELKSYYDQGGTILFGTDVGYTQLYDTTSEYAAMGQAGMSWQDILASLTTTPNAFFKTKNPGRVEKGAQADLVVLDADPAADVRSFAKVAYTIRQGKVIFSSQ